MLTEADLHALIDDLPHDLAEEARRRLNEPRDPLLRTLLAAPEAPPEEDELEAIAEAEPVRREGTVISDAELARGLGL